MNDDPLQQAAWDLQKAAERMAGLPDEIARALAHAYPAGVPATPGDRTDAEHAMALGRAALAQQQAEEDAKLARARQNAGPAVPAFDQSPPAAQGVPAHLARAQAEQEAQASAELAALRAEADRKLGNSRAMAEQNIAAAGQGDGPSALTRTTDAASKSLAVMKTSALAAAAALGTISYLGAKASPTHAATFQGSLDLLAARLGTVLLPAIETFARDIQNIARALPTDRLAQMGEAYSRQLQGPTTGWGLAMMALRATGAVGDEKAKLSFAGLPQSQISTMEAYHDRGQMAALNQGPLEAEILREQLKNLERILGVLERGTPGDTNVGGSFR